MATIVPLANMNRSSAGICLCKPTELYNTLTQCDQTPAVLEENYLILFDARDRAAYEESHVILARYTKKNGDGKYHIPFDVHLPSCLHCIVYDSNTVSIIEETPAVHLANLLALQGAKKSVCIVKRGYERFSAEYPFLRTQKIMYTQKELKRLPHYPSEVIPLFLYLGDQRHAHNAATNTALKIHSHVNMAASLDPAFPAMVTELSVCVEDSPETDLLGRMEEICQFIEEHRGKSERVLVFGESGISRAATAVMAYLMFKNKWSLQEAYVHVESCWKHIRPLRCFLQQLSEWEEKLHGKKLQTLQNSPLTHCNA